MADTDERDNPPAAADATPAPAADEPNAIPAADEASAQPTEGEQAPLAPPETDPAPAPAEGAMEATPPADAAADVNDFFTDTGASDAPAEGSEAAWAGGFGDDLPPEFATGLRHGWGPWPMLVAANVILVAGVIIGMYVFGPWGGGAVPEPARLPAVPPPSRANPPRVTPAEPPTNDAFSLALEEQAFAAGRYREALAQCDRLLAATRGNPQDERLAEFFLLRQAQCRRSLGDMPEAYDGFVQAAESRSPIVRGMALVELARLALADGQYLTARTHGYRAIAALGAVPGSTGIENTCDLVVAEALTRKALAFHGADDALPEATVLPPDPFAGGPTEGQVRALLAAGLARLTDAAVGLQAERTLPDDGGPAVWSVTSVGAPLEEVLHRVAGRSDLDVTWATAEAPARRRAVLVAVDRAPDTRVIEVACGAAGLVARMTGTGAMVHDPRAIRSTAELQDLLLREAVSMWRRRLLREVDVPRHPYAHYALGLLYEHQGETAGAMAEYNLLADRYPRSDLAPRAMLRSAGIRIDLRDYAGARGRLLDLLNHHPNFPQTDVVYLRLGQATLKAGLFAEAVATFRKLYYWELSRSSQMGAAFGAGKGYWLQGEHGDAVTWFRRYRKAAAGVRDADRAEAEYLLGQSLLALGKTAEAQAALRRATAAEAEPALAADILLALAGLLADQAEYAEALALVARVDPAVAPAEHADRATLLEVRVLRAMGLPDRATRSLMDRRPKAAGPRTAIEMEIALARCCVDLGRPDDARRLLETVVAHLDPGPLAQTAWADLAEVHLSAGRTEEAIAAARRVLAESAAPDVRRRALDTLGRAYLRSNDYDRAALAFAGTVPDSREGDQP